MGKSGKRMATKYLIPILLVSFIAIFSFSSAAFADDPFPLFPAMFYGHVQDLNGNAVAWDEIQGCVGGECYTLTKTAVEVYEPGSYKAGEYGLPWGKYERPKKLQIDGTADDSGRLITFKVVVAGKTYGAVSYAEEYAYQTGVNWYEGLEQHVDLRIDTTPTPTNHIIRFEGGVRVETAGNIASYLFPEGVNKVVIAESRKMADSMIGTILAGALNAPILLVDLQTDKTPSHYSVLKGQIDSLNPSEAYLLGGETVVPVEISNYLQDKGCTVKRVAGDDRFLTAVEIIKEVKKQGKNIGTTLYIANGRGETVNGLMTAADGYALAPSADVASNFNPVLLIDKNWNNAEKAANVNTLIDNAGLSNIDKCIILGDTDQVPEAVQTVLTAKLGSEKITREKGDVYTVSASLAAKYADANDASDIVIARGDILADALSGGLLAAKQNAPVIFVNTNSIPVEARVAIKSIVNRDSEAFVLGSTSAVSTAVADEINQIINQK